MDQSDERRGNILTIWTNPTRGGGICPRYGPIRQEEGEYTCSGHLAQEDGVGGGNVLERHTHHQLAGQLLSETISTSQVSDITSQHIVSGSGE
eukprot:4218249-Pyramimonas_sp.AAC.1